MILPTRDGNKAGGVTYVAVKRALILPTRDGNMEVEGMDIRRVKIALILPTRDGNKRKKAK